MRRHLFLPFVFSSLLLTPLAAWASGIPASLFDAPTSFSGVPPASPEVLRSRSAVPQLQLLEDSADRWQTSEGRTVERLTLNLFADVEVVAVLEEVTEVLPGRRVWLGRVEGEPESRVSFGVGEGVVAGTVTLAQRIYLVGVGAGGGGRIDEIDPGLAPAGAEPLEVAPSGKGATGSGSSGSGGDSGAQIDLLIVYTSLARDWYGGQVAIENLIASNMGVYNRALQDSQISTRFRLVGVAEVDYVDSGSLSLDLLRLRVAGDGYLDEVHALRNEKGADLVQLVVRDGYYGGLAYLMAGTANAAFESRAFSVTRALATTTPLHEFGHNLGCNHAPEDPVSVGATEFSFGYKDPGHFRTIMAYACTGTPCHRRFHFSNPNVNLAGRPTGTADQNNSLSINLVRQVVANFRQTVPGACPWAVGHPRYCADCGPCFEGEGDCDGDAQCAGALVCVDDVGASYGFAPGIDVCESVCPWPLGHGRYCLDCGPCFEGQGDCDSDAQCLGGLTCRDDIGALYGFGAGVDVCEESCPLPPGDPDYCLVCGPCTLGEGDCEVGQCLPGQVCNQDVGALYGFTPGTDVCEAPPQVLQLTPVADAYVASTWPDSNFGTDTALRVRFSNGGVGRHSFLKFDVPAIQGSIISAKLRLRTQETAIPEAGFYDADIAPWDETTITWNNWETPPSNATYLRSLHNLQPDTWYEVDVSEAVTGSGLVTLGIASGIDAPNLDFWSRESAWDPVLEVVVQP